MGTGSHRPQWEAAKGREDIVGGIKHARSLPSHTKLKFRRARSPAAPNNEKIARPKAIANEASTSSATAADSTDEKQEGVGANADAIGSDASGDSDSDSDSEAEMRRELDLINKRQALRAQQDLKRKPEAAEQRAKASKWRSDTPFKRSKPANKRSSNRFPGAEQDFLGKYLK